MSNGSWLPQGARIELDDGTTLITEQELPRKIVVVGKEHPGKRNVPRWYQGCQTALIPPFERVVNEKGAGKARAAHMERLLAIARVQIQHSAIIVGVLSSRFR
jgi:hypothetical protein